MEIFKHFERIIAEVESPNILEFGAYDGEDSRTMLGLLGAKKYKYHLFEPNRNLIAELCLNLKEYRDRIKIFNVAIGNDIGVVDFFISSGYNYASSSIREPYKIYDSWPDMKFTPGTCRITTLDHHVEMTMPGEIIDFIWADIQGAEVDLIAGGEETFKRVRYLYTEYSEIEFYRGEIGLQSILDMLPDFEVVDKDGGNVLLINKNL